VVLLTLSDACGEQLAKHCDGEATNADTASNNLSLHVTGSYYMWRVPTQNLIKGKPGTKKKAASKASAVPNTE